jgi:hypothetical protein
MAANNTWSVRHRCGHFIDWDLSHKPPDRRVGFAAWLALRDCTRCWWTKRRNPDHRARSISRARTISRPQRTAQRRSATHQWEITSGMPALEGSVKAVAWARRIRHHLLLTAREGLGIRRGAQEEFAHRYAAPARQITTAAWWIDHRLVAPGEFQRVLASWPASGAAAPTEVRQ